MGRVVSFCIMLFLLSGCQNFSEGVSMQSLDGKWNKKQKLTFRIPVTDAGVPKNIIFVVRNNNDYPYSNIRIFSELKEEKTKTNKTDTLNYILAKPNGEWIGSGFGDTKETLFQYKTDFKFPKNGVYTVTVVHAMRNDVLPGIEDFGLKIVQSTTSNGE